MLTMTLDKSGESINITTISTIKWVLWTAAAMVIVFVCDMVVKYYSWMKYQAPIWRGEDVSYPNANNIIYYYLLYILIGAVVCIIGHYKTISIKPNMIGKRKAFYIMSLLLNVLMLFIFIMVYWVFMNDTLFSYIDHISRVRRYTYEMYDMLMWLAPNTSFDCLLYSFASYQVTRFFFDKSILVKQDHLQSKSIKSLHSIIA